MKWKALQIAMCPHFFSQVSSLYFLEQSCSKASHSPSSQIPSGPAFSHSIHNHLLTCSFCFRSPGLPAVPQLHHMWSHLHLCTGVLSAWNSVSQIFTYSQLSTCLSPCHFLSEVYPNVPLIIMTLAPLIPSTLLYFPFLAALITFNIICNLLIMFILSISSSKT